MILLMFCLGVGRKEAAQAVKKVEKAKGMFLQVSMAGTGSRLRVEGHAGGGRREDRQAAYRYTHSHMKADRHAGRSVRVSSRAGVRAAPNKCLPACSLFSSLAVKGLHRQPWYATGRRRGIGVKCPFSVLSPSGGHRHPRSVLPSAAVQRSRLSQTVQQSQQKKIGQPSVLCPPCPFSSFASRTERNKTTGMSILPPCRRQSALHSGRHVFKWRRRQRMKRGSPMLVQIFSCLEVMYHAQRGEGEG